MTDVGAKYRNKASGVIGTAVAQGEDPEGIVAGGRAIPMAMTQLKLEPEHLDHSHVCQGHDMRWHPDVDLEPLGE